MERACMAPQVSAARFSVAVPFALLALVRVVLIREVPLRTTVGHADEVVERIPAP